MTKPNTKARYVAWMNRTCKCGAYYGELPCWNWWVRGVQITLWLGSGIAKVYHDGGRATQRFRLGEQFRERVMNMRNQ